MLVWCDYALRVCMVSCLCVLCIIVHMVGVWFALSVCILFYSFLFMVCVWLVCFIHLVILYGSNYCVKVGCVICCVVIVYVQ